MANEKETTKKEASSPKKKTSTRSVAASKKGTKSASSVKKKTSSPKKKTATRKVTSTKKSLNKRKTTTKKKPVNTASLPKKRTKAATKKTPKKRILKKPEVDLDLVNVITQDPPRTSSIEHNSLAEAMESGVHGSLMAKEIGIGVDNKVQAEVAQDSMITNNSRYLRSSHWMKPVSLLVFMSAFSLLFVGFVNANRHIDVLNKGEIELSSETILTPSVPVNATAARIIDEVSARYHVPESEVPQVVIVTQALMLREKQEFFTDVENGDRLLLYPQLAIIFRPNTGKIIRVGPVNTQPDQNQDAQSPVATSKSVSSEYRHPVQDAQLPGNPDDFLEYAQTELPKILEARVDEEI